MTVLADTSIWIEYLRHGQEGTASDLDDLLQLGEVILCGPILAEILAGTRPHERATMASLLVPQPWVPLGQQDWLRVGMLAGRLRERGATVPLSDVEIAVAVESANAQLWTLDSHFQHIADLTTIRFYRPST